VVGPPYRRVRPGPSGGTRPDAPVLLARCYLMVRA
jgi:hypothetical protein